MVHSNFILYIWSKQSQEYSRIQCMDTEHGLYPQNSDNKIGKFIQNFN